MDLFRESGYVVYGNDAIDSFSFHASLASNKKLSGPVDAASGTGLRHCGTVHKLSRYYYD
jgi:hypothetical protein